MLRRGKPKDLCQDSSLTESLLPVATKHNVNIDQDPNAPAADSESVGAKDAYASSSSTMDPTKPTNCVTNLASSSDRLPYTRYSFSSNAPTENMRNLPSGFEDSISMQDWNDFWSRIQPIVHDAGRSVCIYWIGKIFLDFALLISIAVLYIFFQMNPTTASLPLILIGSNLGINYVLRKWMFTAQYSHHQALRAVCQRVESTYGWIEKNSSLPAALECDGECDIHNRITGSFFLYIAPAASAAIALIDPNNVQNTDNGNSLPMQLNDGHTSGDLVIRNGYLRIQLFNQRDEFWEWTPISLSKLAEYRTFDRRVTFLENHDMWTSFWSELYANSKEYLVAHQRFVVSHGLFYCCSMWLGILFAKNILCYLLWAYVNIVLFGVSNDTEARFLRCVGIQRDTIQRYAPHGCTMEHRQVCRFQKNARGGGVSTYFTHYLYLFPLSSSQLAADWNASMTGEERI